MILNVLACSNDDDGGEVKPTLSYDYNENLSGDLSNEYNNPESLTFVTGENTITASQTSSDIDYFTFKVPSGYVLSQILVEDYQSSDDAAFIGIVNGSVFPNDALNTEADDLLGGLVYGTSNRGTNILVQMGSLPGVQGFSGSLPSGDYSIWLNQTGATSESTLNFVIVKQN